MKSALFMVLALAAGAEPKHKCVISEANLFGYESQILSLSRLPEDELASRIAAPLHCILQIQEKGEGFLKYLANSFLRPLLGGPQVAILTPDPRYRKIAQSLMKSQGQGSEISRISIMAEHARGAWGFFADFCSSQNNSSCADFLPDEDQIRMQSPLLAASSMLLLRSAYLQVSGAQKEILATRIRKVFEQTKAPGLTRNMIEQIYRELFNPTLDLSSLS